MPPELVNELMKGSKFIAENCLHDKIVITSEGVSLENIKEFYPSDKTQLD